MGVLFGEDNKPVSYDYIGGNNLPDVVMAAHELKSPLALIRQLTLGIKLDEQGLSSTQQQALDRICLTAERALRLTSDLTKATNQANLKLDLEPINPYELCQDIIKELDPVMRAHNCHFKLVGRRNPLLLMANRDLLRRIITNFSDNALNYAESGLIEIRVRQLEFGKIVRLAVRDYGPRLTKHTIDLLIKGNSSHLANRPQSSGLGLIITRKFAETMNGQTGLIRHRAGATFFIDLPTSQQLSLL